MADGISIPGVSDKYKTNDLVKSLMEVERKPLTREQEQLEKYQDQQNAWRDMNQKMASLRESVKTLYSFENPFNNKLAESSDTAALTVDAARDADYGSFKIEVLQEATSDRFLSGSIDPNLTVKAGKYTFGVGDKTVDFTWKGGKLNDFVKALNKRGNNLVKASLIGISSNKKALLLESLKPGATSRLILKDDALDFAKQIDMVSEAKTESVQFSSLADFASPANADSQSQDGMPAISKNNVTSDGNTITIPARGGIEIPLPADLTGENAGNHKIEFTLAVAQTEDITDSANSKYATPNLPSPGSVVFGGVTVTNAQSDTALSAPISVAAEKLEPISNENYIAIKYSNGEEQAIDTASFARDEETGLMTVSVALRDYPDAQSLIVRNSNTGKELTLSIPEAYDAAKDVGYAPNHAISTAGDATLKYEGITLTRDSNDIDDIVPNVTLHLHNKTERPATVTISPDKESAKDALITFVGKYNQVLAEMNILTTSKPEVISELDYLSADEQETAEKQLGMFQGDFSLTNGKSTLQRVVSNTYKYDNNTEITMLNQIGISTNASTGSVGYNASQLRGYLEVDEKKLDAALENNLEDIKNLFGYDSDGDLIIDDGIGFQLDKQVNSWVQTGGIISNKIAALNTQIKNSNTKITKLQTQLDEKEAQLKQKYSNMEGTLNSLEGQQRTITNFSNSGNRNQ